MLPILGDGQGNQYPNARCVYPNGQTDGVEETRIPSPTKILNPVQATLLHVDTAPPRISRRLNHAHS